MTNKQLEDDLPEVPPFDVELLPKAFQAYAVEQAEALQVPLEFTAVPLMIFAGSTIGRQVGIFPQARSSWIEFPNLWGGLIGSPGLKKSAAIGTARRFFKYLIERAEEDYAREKRSFEARKKAYEEKDRAALEAYEEEVEKLLAENPDAELPDPPILQSEKPEPTLRRYSCSQSTQQALVELLIENPRGVLLERDELVTLLQYIEGREQSNDKGMFLSGWSAKEHWGYDTIGRGRRNAEFITLSIIGTSQPAKMLGYTKKALEELGGDGLIARFALLVWPDTPKTWRNVDRPPNEFAIADVKEVFLRLDRLGDPLKPTLLRFDEEGQKVFYGWYEDWEQRLREEVEHPAVVSHLAKYTSLIPALALICGLVDSPGCVAVDAVAAERAVRWASYLEGHARRVYSNIKVSEAEDAARRLFTAMQSGILRPPVSGRDIQQKKWVGLRKKKEIAAALNILLEKGLVVQEEEFGKSTPRFRVARRLC